MLSFSTLTNQTAEKPHREVFPKPLAEQGYDIPLSSRGMSLCCSSSRSTIPEGASLPEHFQVYILTRGSCTVWKNYRILFDHFAGLEKYEKKNAEDGKCLIFLLFSLPLFSHF